MKKSTKDILAEDYLKALGKLSILVIGVDDYSHHSFQSLKTCSNDAITVKEVLMETVELNADADRIFEITSLTETKPSRGEIIKAVTKLSDCAEENERIMLFFSGHGHKINNKFYIVPQDVYDDNDPSALIDYDYLVSILNKSLAKLKIIILDSCFSGESFTLSKGISLKKKKSLNEYITKVKGFVIISSSSSDQESTTKSPNEKLSLFTHYFSEALKGNDNEALDEDKFLTADSLFKYISHKVTNRSKSYHLVQTPCIHKKASGTIFLADFSPRHSENTTQRFSTTQVLPQLSPYQRLFHESIQKWRDFNIFPDAETIIALKEGESDAELSSTQIGFLYFSSFFRIDDLGNFVGNKSNFYPCFDDLFFPLKLNWNTTGPVLLSVVVKNVEFLRTGNANWCISYPKYMVAILSILINEITYCAAYCFVRDSEGEGLELLIIKDNNLTTSIRHMGTNARVNMQEAFDLLEKNKSV